MNRTFFLSLLALLAMIGSPSSVQADEQGDKYYDNVEWVKNAQQAIPARAQGKLNASDYCAEPGCDRKIAGPEEANLTDGNMTSKKQSAMHSNAEAQAVKISFDQGRPEVKSDPAYEFALIAQDNAYEISHGISNQYVDCDNATQCTIDYLPKICRQPTNSNVPCTKTPAFTVVTSPVIYTCPSGWTRKGHSCEKWGTKEVRGDAENHCIYDRRGWWSCIWDGKRVSVDGPPYRPGERIFITWQIIKQPLYKRSASLTCRSGYTLSGGNCIKNTVRWTTHCSLLKECKVTSQRCIEGRATRRINGVPTTLNCWKYQVNHRCTRTNTCNALPADCTTTATHCSAKQKGVCIEKELSKSCPQKRCSTTNLMCGEDSFCLDGDCYGEMPTTSTEFNESAAALAALAKAAEGLGDPPKIFTGQGQTCSKKIAGIANCCKDGGWGTDVGLASCSEQEKALGKAKEDKLTIYLGSYCAEKILGKCIRKKQAYCLFDSLLARIVQQQGVQGQLGLSLGTPRMPECGAITPEQMQQINFEDIDFSDFFAEMNSNTDLPSSREIQERISSAMGG
ncbi:Conjugal transfer mating pair stabilization protein TraN [Vibrio chagasii]|nr:Conjugal transfer mating pair stabilization protein TraN [Vibrio chagasii]CAH7240433.1 Conjugal transfer mating pair stabilization protein TraN [Vibrio chagasii]CAH7437356.1 Conjugal transfer mating pair stabilization protein TraN [Vibrio chagasii]